MTTAPATDTTTPTTGAHGHRRGVVPFVGHYLEMVVAMATDMTVAMVLWMAVRRHSWPRIAEMAAVMYLPFLALLVPHWLGALSGSAVLMAGHVIMFPLMLAAMLWRRHDYGL